MKIELRNIKHAHGLSQETNAYTADIYVDGKKAGTSQNNGGGGDDDYYFTDPAVRRAAEAFCKAMPPNQSQYGPLPMSLGFHLSLLVEADLKNKEEKRILHQKKRWCKADTVFRLKGDKPGSYRRHPRPYSPEIKVWLNQKYGDKIEEIVNETIAR